MPFVNEDKIDKKLNVLNILIKHRVNIGDLVYAKNDYNENDDDELVFPTYDEWLKMFNIKEWDREYMNKEDYELVIGELY